MTDKTTPSQKGVVFVDRDGVLIENRQSYVRSWEDVEIFARALEAGRRLSEQGYSIVVVTNQACVGKGIVDLALANEINDRVVAEFRDQGTAILASYLCPHLQNDDCDCRKPKPGMLLRGIQEFEATPEHSWMVGDALTDMQAAQAAGVQGLLVRTGRGREQEAGVMREGKGIWPVFDDLLAAAHWILARP